ncbi:putative membrane protein [Photobacterium leiognathi lrivu.4.1]|uniref:Putative membrane protein n=1 Tax=Photobacterium leiognathi lrivu.4.1 TaxID=1248232 RepID=V5F298_PHOLE|nr:putative membrane protein [Photobacterium leiognathi lrivu.4.1]
MITAYAKWSKNYPKLHIGAVSLVFIIFGYSSYLLINEYLWAFLGIIIPFPFFLLFSKASEYKNKYLHNKG